MALRGRLFRGQRHADHGSGLAYGGAHRFVFSGRVGTDRRVPAHVFAGPARWRAGRHHRPPAPYFWRAHRANGRLRLVGLAGAGRLGRAGLGAVPGVYLRLLHSGAHTGLELLRGRSGASRRMAAGHHRHQHCLQRGARHWPVVGGSAVCAVGRRPGFFSHRLHDAGDVGVDTPLAATRASTNTPAG